MSESYESYEDESSSEQNNELGSFEGDDEAASIPSEEEQEEVVEEKEVFEQPKLSMKDRLIKSKSPESEPVPIRRSKPKQNLAKYAESSSEEESSDEGLVDDIKNKLKINIIDNRKNNGFHKRKIYTRYTVEVYHNGKMRSLGVYDTIQKIADKLDIPYSKAYRIFRQQDPLCKTIKITRLEEKITRD